MQGIGDVWGMAADKWDEVMAQVGDDDWDKSTPCDGWTVRELVDHAVPGLRRHLLVDSLIRDDFGEVLGHRHEDQDASASLGHVKVLGEELLHGVVFKEFARDNALYTQIENLEFLPNQAMKVIWIWFCAI